jgi:hypothetical protein
VFDGFFLCHLVDKRETMGEGGNSVFFVFVFVGWLLHFGL